MEYHVTIDNKNGQFPIRGLNELLAGRKYDPRTKKYRNFVKSMNDDKCKKAFYKCMRGVKLKTPIRCTYYIYVENKKHDRGNVYAAVEKSALDALQQCGILSSDKYDCVLDSEFHTDVIDIFHTRRSTHPNRLRWSEDCRWL